MTLLLLTLACAGSKSPPETSEAPATAVKAETRDAEARATAVVEVPVDEAPPAVLPEGVQPVRDLLLARHADDLPDKATLSSHEGALEHLQWLAANDDQMMVRARALDLLGYWDEALPLLRQMAGDAEAHGKLRAAAILGLVRSDLSDDEASRTLLGVLTSDPDERVAAEAQAALASE
jgi:hypothetical protein